MFFPRFPAIDQFQTVPAPEGRAGPPCLLPRADERDFVVSGKESLLPGAITRRDNLDFDPPADDAQL